jgi:septation ring formation regulator EzrA
MAKEKIQELIALLEQSSDAKTKIIDKQSEMISFLKAHIKNLGMLIDEYEQIAQKYINQNQENGKN